MRAFVAFFNRWFRWIALPLVMFGIALALRREAPAIAALDWRSAWRSMLAAALAFAVAPVAQSVSFWLVLRLLGARAPFGEAMRIWADSYVLRYAPSGALAVVYRVRQKARLAATRDQVLAGEAYEHLGALVAGVAACLLAFALLGTVPPTLGALAAIPVVLLAVAVHPALLGRAVRRCLRRLRIEAPLLGGRGLALVASVNLGAWPATGIGTLVVASSLSDAAAPPLLWVVGTYAVAYLVGFMTPFLPGGLGAREAVLVLLLAPHYGFAASAAIALAVRVAVTLGEVVAVFALAAWNPCRRAASRVVATLARGAAGEDARAEGLTDALAVVPRAQRSS